MSVRWDSNSLGLEIFTHHLDGLDIGFPSGPVIVVPVFLLFFLDGRRDLSL